MESGICKKFPLIYQVSWGGQLELYQYQCPHPLLIVLAGLIHHQETLMARVLRELL